MARPHSQRGVFRVYTRLSEGLAQLLFYAALVLAANALFAQAQPAVEAQYQDALTLFEKRDLKSIQGAINLLEKNIDLNAEHLETQALIGFVYAHEANILSQLGQSSTEYLNSANAFAQNVLLRDPKNKFAIKTTIYLLMIGGKNSDAAKLLSSEMNEKETDADLWYFQAALTDGDKSLQSLARALELKPDHVWIYSDMAFRALRLNNLSVAEKWISALETRSPNTADALMLRAIFSAQKKDITAASSYWSSFESKAAGLPVIESLKAYRTK